MELDKDATPALEREETDLYKRQDRIIKEIRKKEKPGLVRRLIALLQYFFRVEYPL